MRTSGLRLRARLGRAARKLPCVALSCGFQNFPRVFDHVRLCPALQAALHRNPHSVKLDPPPPKWRHHAPGPPSSSGFRVPQGEGVQPGLRLLAVVSELVAVCPTHPGTPGPWMAPPRSDHVGPYVAGRLLSATSVQTRLAQVSRCKAGPQAAVAHPGRGPGCGGAHVPAGD